MAAAAAPLLAPDLAQRRQASSTLLRALSKSEHYNDLNPTPGPGTAAEDLWTAFELLASQVENNPDVVDKIAHLTYAFALSATAASSPLVLVTTAVTSSGSAAPLVSGDALRHMLDLIKQVSPKARQWAARRQEELKAAKDQTQASRKAQEEYERKAVWWINSLAARTNPETGVGLDAEYIEVVAMSLGVLLQATSLTVRRTLQLESKGSTTGKVIGFSSGVVLGALLCAGGLFCPLTLVAAPLVGGVSAGAIAGASAATLAGASTAIGSVVGVVKSGCKLDRTRKLEVNMSKVDITVRALVGYLCFLYHIQIDAREQNGNFFIEHLQDLGLSQPVSKWNDRSFMCTFFEEAAADLEKGTLELNTSLRKMGLSVDPLACA